MELVYTLINFLLLAVIVFIALRKTIKKIFTSRRERIDTELDEAEALERASKELEEELAALPVDQAPSPQAEEPEDELDSIAKQLAEKKARLTEASEKRLAGQKRDAMLLSREKAVKTLCELLRVKLSEEPNVSAIRKYEGAVADEILKRIELTPGDMCL